MDIATLNSTLSGVGVIAALLFIVAIVLIVQRTGSTHVLTHRLWRWATDRQDVKDEMRWQHATSCSTRTRLISSGLSQQRLCLELQLNQSAS